MNKRNAAIFMSPLIMIHCALLLLIIILITTEPSTGEGNTFPDSMSPHSWYKLEEEALLHIALIRAIQKGWKWCAVNVWLIMGGNIIQCTQMTIFFLFVFQLYYFPQILQSVLVLLQTPDRGFGWMKLCTCNLWTYQGLIKRSNNVHTIKSCCY